MDNFKKSMKEWSGGSYLFMKITLRVTGDIKIMAIRYKQNSWKVLVSIYNQGDGRTEPGDTYLSHFPENYYHVSIQPVV